MEVKKLFKYRNICMALAILWIMFRHAGITITNTPIKWIKEFGYGGVDIFLFASGLGCYFSLSKDSNVGSFIKKRFLKIMPTYWCFIGFWIAFKKIMETITIREAIGNILAIQSFTVLENDFNWYISAIWLLYILSPYFVKIADKIKSWKGFLAVVGVLILFSVPFWNSRILIITMTRIPIFFMGMYLAKIADKNEFKITKLKAIFAIVVMILGFVSLFASYYYFENKLWNYGLYWYPFILITPGLCLLITYLSYLLEKIRFGNLVLKLLGIIGNNTFEIYLVHILIFSILKRLIASGEVVSNIRNWLITLPIIIVCCILLKLLTKFVMFCSSKLINKKQV